MDAASLVRGISPVLEVPFLEDESVDLDGFDRVVTHVLSTGVTSVMFPGFASEFHKLTDGERAELRDRLLVQTRDRDDVAAIISVPDHATTVAVRQAVAAIEAGADAINVLPPYFLGPSPASVTAHLEAVLRTCNPVPVVVQYAPGQTGTSLDASLLSGLRNRHENLALVKVESTPPGRLIQALQHQDPPLPAVVGYAGVQLVDAWRRGAVGVQPGCSFTELYVEIWRLLEADDVAAATALHTRMVPWLSYWMQGVELIVAAEKLISQRRGLIGSATCRGPAYCLDAEEVLSVERFLDEFADLLPRVSS